MDELHPEQIKAYRRMSPAEKLTIAAGLQDAARELKRAWLAQQHPDWSEERINQVVKEIFLYARS